MPTFPLPPDSYEQEEEARFRRYLEQELSGIEDPGEPEPEVLGRVERDPETTESFAVGLVVGAVDETNLTVTFDAPNSGSVEVRGNVWLELNRTFGQEFGGSTRSITAFLSVLDDTDTVLDERQAVNWERGNISSSSEGILGGRVDFRFVVEGLSGEVTLKLGSRYSRSGLEAEAAGANIRIGGDYPAAVFEVESIV